ncbi:glycosyltransferase family 4 protein [Actinomycetospora chiangmaiensis]|uniref:glycosyltransferase family 4 protein n=1 Tax=Actinomycetospora chiangmaiensis TaxID=402650 RepID=UPI00036EFD60|nr:glycosyltransferase family 4 protein [Actinomycetospora chiangmaiensis]
MGSASRHRLRGASRGRGRSRRHEQGGATIVRTESPVENDLVIVLTYYAPYVSGLTNVARDVAEGLAARGWRVCVVASRHDDSLPGTETINGVRVVRAPVLARVGKGTIGINLTRLALREMRRSRIANLHLPLIEAGLLTRLAPIPVVSTYHCDVSLPPGAVNALQREAVDRSNRGGLRRSVATIVTSEDYARQSRLWADIAPHMVAIPPPCAPVEPAAPTYRRGDGFHVGFLGRIVEEKGVEHLVDAFLGLDDPDARLLIGGDHSRIAGGSVVDRVRAHIGGDPRVELLGFVPDERLGEFYASIDTFALPSVNAFEAFGIVQVVGMLAGVPALASDLPGVRLPVERTGFGRIVAPGDVAGLREALRALRDTPPDRAAGRAAAAADFSVDSVLDAYEAVFTKAG